MYALRRRGRRTRNVRTVPPKENSAAAVTPNSVQRGVDTPSDPALADKMRARMHQNFPGERGSGRPLELPDELRESLETHFGHSVDNIQFRESSDADALGAKAYARGNEIHFAPGQFRPDTALGRKMIGHELSHIRQQASGAPLDNAARDSAAEHQADVDGDAVSSGESAPARDPASALSPMPAASFDAAPAQGWGIGLLPFKKGEHEKLTKAARKKAKDYAKNQEKNATGADQQIYKDTAKELGSFKASQSLEYGSRFNDVGHHSIPGFLWHMGPSHSDAFINQTHHGDMQFLHSMDTSKGDTKENMAKARRYAKFASDVYQNENDEQNTNMLDYLLADNESEEGEEEVPEGGTSRLQKMMLSTMLSPEKLKQIEEATEGDDEARMAAIKQAAKVGQDARQWADMNYDNLKWYQKLLSGGKKNYVKKAGAKAGLSKYAQGTIGDFYTNGDTDLDAGLVALGSASHMIEDSYAGSHAIRSENLYLGDRGRKETDLSENGKAIVDKSTDVITAADYNQQDANLFGGRHPKGDKFRHGLTTRRKINNTRGGALARDASAQFMYMNARQKKGGAGGANDFLKGILKEDAYAASLPGGVTATGSAYAKEVGGNSDEENAIAKAFHKSTKGRAKNVHADASKRAAEYDSQIEQVETLRASDKQETSDHYTRQSNEMLANINSMIQQLENAPKPLSKKNLDTLDKLKAQRAHLESQLAR